MKKNKILLGLLIAGLGGLLSAFTSKPSGFATPPDGAGWYAAEDRTIDSDLGSYTYSNSTQYPSFLGNTEPSSGTGVGQCATDATFICAVNFDADGNSIASTTGDYHF